MVAFPLWRGATVEGSLFPVLPQSRPFCSVTFPFSHPFLIVVGLGSFPVSGGALSLPIRLVIEVVVAGEPLPV